MKILAISDEEFPSFYDQYRPGVLDDYDLILSCGDLRPSYLSFIVTVAKVPVLYVHGNHDGSYDRTPPEGCDCIEDKIVVYKGLRIMGLGGCRQYRPGPHQYTERQMQTRIRKLWWQLRRHKGVDIVVTHAPPLGVGDDGDMAHRGFSAFLTLMEKYRPKYLLHGHSHLNYGMDKVRQQQYLDTTVINAYQRYTLEIPDGCIKS